MEYTYKYIRICVCTIHISYIKYYETTKKQNMKPVDIFIQTS